MDLTGKTSDYIRKRLRQKGYLKNTSKIGNKTSTVRTIGEIKRSDNKADPIVQSPYRIEKQDPDNPKYKSEFQWLFDPVKGVAWDFNPVALRQLAQGDAWVQMLVNTMTTEIANTPWQIVEEDGSEVQKNHNPFERVSKGVQKEPAETLDAKRARMFLQSPNPDQDFTDFIEELVADYLEIGSLTSVKVFSEDDYDGDSLSTNNPNLIHAQPSDPVTWTKEFKKKTGIVGGFWQYDRSSGSQSNQFRTTSTSRSKPTRFSRKEIGWKDINPRTNRRYGFPPTLAVRNILELMDLTVEQEQDFFSRGAHLAGFLKSNGDINEIDALQDEASGEKGRVGGFFHTSDPEAEWVQMGTNWKDMDMTEREKWYAQVIASEFQVPTSVVGLETEELNRATFEAERGNFESNTLGPYLQDLERWITQNFIKPHFSEDLRFEWMPGMSENQRSSISERIRGEFESQLITRNEARREIGYSETDEAEDGFKDDVTEDPQPEQDLQDQLALSQFGKEDVGKPFGPWDDFEDCVQEMQQEEGYSEEEAKRVCGSLQAELKECEQCGDKIEKDNKRFCSKECYHDFLSKQDDDEPLRSDEEYFKYDFQPRHVEQFKEELQDPINSALKQIFQDDRFNQLVERFAEDEEHDTTQKNSAELRRVLNDLIKDAAVSQGLETVIRDQSTSIAVTALQDQVADTGLEADVDEVAEQVESRELGFVQNFSQRMEEDLRDTVSQGWQQGQSVQEIQENLQAKADDLSDHQAETIARDQLQRATGEARNNFAKQHSDKFVEVWNAVSDNRTRPSHEEMDGKWKRPAESFEVQYERANGPVKETFPGDSEHGINCRCRTDLVAPDEVSNSNYGGEGSP